MQVIPGSSGDFGAEIRGLDLALPQPREVIDAFRAALVRYRVVFVRHQSLSPEQQLAFARRLGPVEPPESSGPLSTHFASCPELQWLSYLRADGSEPADGRPSQADVWHTDYAYLPEPAELGFLYGVEIPEDGPDTLFLDMQAAAEALAPDRVAALSALSAIHRQKGGLDPAQYRLPPYLRPDEADDGSAERQAAHPLLRPHRITGRRCLYLAQCYTIGIEGMDPAAARAEIDALYDHALAVAPRYRHVWQPGDCVLWDNSAINHRRSKPLDAPRVLHRLTIRLVANG